MVILFLFALANADWWESLESTSLTENNYQEVIGLHSAVVLEFYSPYCEFCKSLKDDYEKVWKHFSNHPEITVARTNAIENQKLAQLYRVESFPTILFIPPHTWEAFSEFEGHRTFENIVKWVNLSYKLANEDVQYQVTVKDASAEYNVKWRAEFEFLNNQIEEFKTQVLSQLESLQIQVTSAEKQVKELQNPHGFTLYLVVLLGSAVCYLVWKQSKDTKVLASRDLRL